MADEKVTENENNAAGTHPVQRQVMTYREDDWKAEVEIIENNSDDKCERYRLKVIRTLRESRIFKPMPDGEIFNVEHNKYSGIYPGQWSLYE